VVTHIQEHGTRTLHHAETGTEYDAALFGASFLYQKRSGTTDQSNCTILPTCIGKNLWYKLQVQVS